MQRIVLLFTMVLILQGCSNKLTLGEDFLGQLPLRSSTNLSLEYVKKTFPDFKVYTGIGEGDSANYHYYRVTGPQGESLFTLFSYVRDRENTAQQPLDLVVVSSPKLVDKYGVSVGDSYAEVLESRTGKLIFGASHHDNYLGAGEIWYSFAQEIEEGEPDPDPLQTRRSDLQGDEFTIRAISWPRPRW